MKKMLYGAWVRKASVVVAAGVLAAGCTLQDGAAPLVAGPSEFGLSVTMTASPDQLPRDGASQSTVTVMVRDDSSRPVGGRRLIASTTTGTLSAGEVITSSDGRATLSFTAPAPGTLGDAALVSVVPVGDNGGNSVPRTLTINFTGPSNRMAPVPDFTYTPAKLERAASARFDASATTDEGVVCLDECSYAWDFGDGSTSTGRITNHTFSASGTFIVTLTVTDRAGSSASKGVEVAVADVPAPTVSLRVAPSPPIAGQVATFTASIGTVQGRIRSYQWTFGDGTSQTTTVPTVTKVFANPGTYVTTVVATDDLGQTGAASLSFVIGSSVTASFTISPTAPITGETVFFNGSASTGSGGSTIVTWAWDFGDGATASDSVATTSHPYAAEGTYVVRLTVTDSDGRTGTTTVNVAVKAP